MTWRVIEFVRRKDGEGGYDTRVLHRGLEISPAVALVLQYKNQGRHTTVVKDK